MIYIVDHSYFIAKIFMEVSLPLVLKELFYGKMFLLCQETRKDGKKKRSSLPTVKEAPEVQS